MGNARLWRAAHAGGDVEARATGCGAQEDRLAALVTARPHATLIELREALPTTAALSTIWRAVDRLGLSVKKTVHADE